MINTIQILFSFFRMKQQHKRKADWFNNMKSGLQGTEETLEAEIHVDFLKVSLKYQKYQESRKLKAPGHEEFCLIIT